MQMYQAARKSGLPYIHMQRPRHLRRGKSSCRCMYSTATAPASTAAMQNHPAFQLSPGQLPQSDPTKQSPACNCMITQTTLGTSQEPGTPPCKLEETASQPHAIAFMYSAARTIRRHKPIFPPPTLSLCVRHSSNVCMCVAGCAHVRGGPHNTGKQLLNNRSKYIDIHHMVNYATNKATPIYWRMIPPHEPGSHIPSLCFSL